MARSITRSTKIVREDGTVEWYFNRKLHREDGPAVINSNGTTEWWLKGKLHREDGPAVIHPDGTTEWYIDGEETKPILMRDPRHIRLMKIRVLYQVMKG